jgi:hypothetical protein
MMALDSQSGNMAGISQSGRAANLQTYAALRQGGQALQRKALRQGGQALQEISIPAGWSSSAEKSITAGWSSPAGNKHSGRQLSI